MGKCVVGLWTIHPGTPQQLWEPLFKKEPEARCGSVLGKQGQGSLWEFEASLVYITSRRPAWATQ